MLEAAAKVYLTPDVVEALGAKTHEERLELLRALVQVRYARAVGVGWSFAPKAGSRSALRRRRRCAAAPPRRLRAASQKHDHIPNRPITPLLNRPSRSSAAS